MGNMHGNAEKMVSHNVWSRQQYKSPPAFTTQKRSPTQSSGCSGAARAWLGHKLKLFLRCALHASFTGCGWRSHTRLKAPRGLIGFVSAPTIANFGAANRSHQRQT